MRTFIAIELNDAVREALWALSLRLQQSGVRASWAKPRSMHLTLRFLGEIPVEDVGRIGDLLAPRYAGTEPFSLRVAEAGAFPNARKPSVVWAGVGPLEGHLAQVQSTAEEAARAIGLAAEKRRYRPHLTIARIRDAAKASKLAPVLAREGAFDGGSFSVGSVSLFSSELGPGGAVYERLREFSF